MTGQTRLLDMGHEPRKRARRFSLAQIWATEPCWTHTMIMSAMGRRQTVSAQQIAQYDLASLSERIWLLIRLLDSTDRRRFACWCARQHWRLLTDPRSRHAVETAERFCEGGATAKELGDAAYDAASASYAASSSATSAAYDAANASYASYAASSSAAYDAYASAYAANAANAAANAANAANASAATSAYAANASAYDAYASAYAAYAAYAANAANASAATSAANANATSAYATSAYAANAAAYAAAGEAQLNQLVKMHTRRP